MLRSTLLLVVCFTATYCLAQDQITAKDIVKVQGGTTMPINIKRTEFVDLKTTGTVTLQGLRRHWSKVPGFLDNYAYLVGGRQLGDQDRLCLSFHTTRKGYLKVAVPDTWEDPDLSSKDKESSKKAVKGDPAFMKKYYRKKDSNLAGKTDLEASFLSEKKFRRGGNELGEMLEKNGGKWLIFEKRVQDDEDYTWKTSKKGAPVLLIEDYVGKLYGADMKVIKPGAKVYEGNNSIEWTSVPPAIANCLFSRHNHEVMKSGWCHFKVNVDGNLYLAVTDRWKGKEKGNWRKELSTASDLKKDGWRKTDYTLRDSNSQWLVYSKYCRTDQKYSYRTEKSHAPIVIIPKYDTGGIYGGDRINTSKAQFKKTGDKMGNDSGELETTASRIRKGEKEEPKEAPKEEPKPRDEGTTGPGTLF